MLRRPHAIDVPVGKEHRNAHAPLPPGITPAKPVLTIVPPARLADAEDAGAASLAYQNKKLLGDAPACDSCGHITIRNGTCYKCLNCGNSMGCS